MHVLYNTNTYTRFKHTYTIVLYCVRENKHLTWYQQTKSSREKRFFLSLPTFFHPLKIEIGGKMKDGHYLHYSILPT